MLRDHLGRDGACRLRGAVCRNSSKDASPLPPSVLMLKFTSPVNIPWKTTQKWRRFSRRIQRLATADAFERKVGVKLGQPVPLLGDMLPDVDKEHFDLDISPVKAVAERLPRDPIESPENDISQDMATFLEFRLLRPWTHRALQIFDPYVVEAGSGELFFCLSEPMHLRAQVPHANVEIVAKVTPRIWLIARTVITSCNVMELLKLKPPAGLQVSRRRSANRARRHAQK